MSADKFNYMFPFIVSTVSFLLFLFAKKDNEKFYKHSIFFMLIYIANVINSAL